MTGSSVLDQWESRASLDPEGMRLRIEAFPDQLQDAMRIARNIRMPASDAVRAIVVTGLGGSAIGADVVRSAFRDVLPIPLLVNRDYDLPRHVDESTLVVACSYSGNTEETLEAFERARRVRAVCVCITSGGDLGREAAAAGVPVVSIPGGLPPRAALGYSSVALMGILNAVGMLPNPQESLPETIAVCRGLVERCRDRIPEIENPAKRIARALFGKVTAIYASAGLDAAAIRWRGQLEENAKSLAFHHTLPEMNHNELVGWDRPESCLAQIAVVFLRDRGEHPQIVRRFELTREIIASRAGSIHSVFAEGEGTLARMFSLILKGDFVSLYLAYLNGSDPTPVSAIERLKKSLGD